MTTTVSKDIQIRLEPPRIAVLSTKHYLNHGGSEFVVYRATPPDVDSGVRVGDIEYRGIPASGAGLPASDPALKVAFFGLLHDQPLNTPVVAFARDAAGNEAHISFVDDVFEKPFRKSRIPIDDRFLGRVVPEILEHSPQVKVDNPGDLLAGFLKVNGELRRINADQILAFGKNSGPNCCGRGRSRSLATRRSRPPSPTPARISTTAKTSTSRRTLDSTWRSRPTFRSSPRTPARS